MKVARVHHVLTMAIALIFAAACSGTSNQQAAEEENSPIERLRRPLQLPSIRNDESCPTTTFTSQPSRDLGQLTGTALARPILLHEPDGTVRLAPAANLNSSEWGGNKVLWAVSPDARGQILIRGRRLDGDGELRFSDGSDRQNAEPLTELVLNPHALEALDGGWRHKPGSTRAKTPGCYGYQIDTTSGTDFVIFRFR